MHPILSRSLFWPTFGWNALLGRWLKRRQWWNRVDDHILLGAMPLRSDVPRLAAEGVTAVVNMCKEYPGPVDLYKKHGIEQLWLPTVDFNPPSLADVEKGVDFIQRTIDAGGQVYIHCKAGRARSATVLLCFLVKHRHMTPDQAQQYLLEHRPHVHPRLPGRAVVREFIAKQKQNPT